MDSERIRQYLDDLKLEDPVQVLDLCIVTTGGKLIATTATGAQLALFERLAPLLGALVEQSREFVDQTGRGPLIEVQFKVTQQKPEDPYPTRAMLMLAPLTGPYIYVVDVDYERIRLTLPHAWQQVATDVRLRQMLNEPDS